MRTERREKESRCIVVVYIGQQRTYRNNYFSLLLFFSAAFCFLKADIYSPIHSIAQCTLLFFHNSANQNGCKGIFSGVFDRYPNISFFRFITQAFTWVSMGVWGSFFPHSSLSASKSEKPHCTQLSFFSSHYKYNGLRHAL